MSSKRHHGGIQPGISWGPFTLRVPFVHTRFSAADYLQGIAVAGATGLALVPIFTSLMGLSFEEAVTMAMFHSLFISMSWFVFGDPYAPGWLTPAVPFVIGFLTLPGFRLEGGGFDHTAQFQAMTAMSIDFALILIVLGASGLGAKLVKFVPDVFKGGIILGAALAAFLRVTKEGDSSNVFEQAPIAGTLGVAVCMLLAFSKPIQERMGQHKWLATLVGLGLLPGFILAGSVGFFTGEFTYNIRWEFLNLADSSVALWQKTSPFVIGWPSMDIFLSAFPLALITYILFFGDLVTGDEMIEHTQLARPDEKLDLSSSRTHLSTGIRNVLMAVTAPFFSTQGVMWTGIQVILLKRWALGRDKVDSFFDSLSSFYAMFFLTPVLFIMLPAVTLLQPLLPLALAVTLILTGFACATLALSLVKDATERGTMVIFAMALSVFPEPWMGMLVGIISIIVLCGPKVFIPNHKIEEFGPIDKHEPSPGASAEPAGAVSDASSRGNTDPCDAAIADYRRRVALENQRRSRSRSTASEDV
ncbi:hypothetical protein [Ketobacter sp.]